MKATDLRLGNIVQTRQGKMTKVNISNLINLIDFESGKYDDDPPILPILINHEWLLKLGFNDEEYKDGYIGIDFESGQMTLSFVIAKPKKLWENQIDYVFMLHGHRIVTIKYVHELQNIFHAVTSHELNL